MSHKLKMIVKNSSSHTLKSYSVSHSWDDHHENLSGDDLANGGTESPSVEITSGYTQYDWYTIQINFDAEGWRQTNFYCNSSHSQDKIIMEIFDDYLNCSYYCGDKYDTGCNKKHWSGDFKDEKNQIDPKKIKP